MLHVDQHVTRLHFEPLNKETKLSTTEATQHLAFTPASCIGVRTLHKQTLPGTIPPAATEDHHDPLTTGRRHEDQAWPPQRADFILMQMSAGGNFCLKHHAFSV